MTDKIVRATVEGDRPVFINGILHLRGEDAYANLDDLGVKSLGDKTPGLKAKSAKSDEPIAEVAIAAVAPHAPNAPNAQGIAPGTVMSGTGRLITPAMSDDDVATHPVGADANREEEAAATKQSGATQKPAKPTK
jgi:hypothetical protein